jgi:hypothetical protein
MNINIAQAIGQSGENNASGEKVHPNSSFPTVFASPCFRLKMRTGAKLLLI